MLFSHRLNHGECVPTSIATQHRRIPANFCAMAFRVVATVPSVTTSPLSASMQYRMVLSPRSMPIVIGTR
jgi:hypothetical protein